MLALSLFWITNPALWSNIARCKYFIIIDEVVCVNLYFMDETMLFYSFSSNRFRFYVYLLKWDASIRALMTSLWVKLYFSWETNQEYVYL